MKKIAAQGTEEGEEGKQASIELQYIMLTQTVAVKMSQWAKILESKDGETITLATTEMAATVEKGGTCDQESLAGSTLT